MTLVYDLEQRDRTVVLRLTGLIDRDALAALDDGYAAAAAAEAAVVELDFTGVEYINSTGIALIVGLLGKARSHGRTVRAAGLTDHYQHIFEITRLSDFIEIVQPAEPS